MPSDRIIEIEVISSDHVNRQNIEGDWIMRRIIVDANSLLGFVVAHHIRSRTDLMPYQLRSLSQLLVDYFIKREKSARLKKHVPHCWSYKGQKLV